MSAKVNAECDKVNIKQNCWTRADWPYPNLFILPLHRLLQVRYFPNKTFLFVTQLTDVLNSSKRKSSLRCRERKQKERNSACIYTGCGKKREL